MSTLEIWLIAIGLAMDCLAVSITSGILLKTIQWRTMLVMACSFGFFQGAMPFFGWLGASRFNRLIESVDHWIAFAILLFLGGKMIWESLRSDEEHETYDPSRPRVVLALSVATSIDALAVGVTFAFLGMSRLADILSPILIIGFVSFALSMAGLFFGLYFGRRHNLHMELWGGLILILIGCKILVEHLFLT